MHYANWNYALLYFNLCDAVGTHCVVKYCPNIFKKTVNVSFHKIRADETARQKWMNALEINNALRPGVKLDSTTARICGAHFTKECFSLGILENGSTKLLPKAVPSIFPKAPVPLSSDGPSSAKKRRYQGKFKLLYSSHFQIIRLIS